LTAVLAVLVALAEAGLAVAGALLLGEADVVAFFADAGCLAA